MNLASGALLDVGAADALRPVPSGARIAGYDVARSLAILSMLVDHCGQVIGIGTGRFWKSMFELIDGRASAIFVLLAGVGVSLLERRKPVRELRRTLLRRGALLLLMGMINQVIWP